MKRETWYSLVIWGTMIFLTLVVIYSILALDYWYYSTKGDMQNAVLTFFPYVLAMAALVVLLVMSWKRIYIFPVSVLAAIAGVLTMHDIGIYLGLYDVYIAWWDKVAHYIAALIVAYVSFYFLIHVNFYSKTIKITPLFLILFTVAFTCTFGMGWEIYELISDEVLGSTMQYMSFIDTMQDMSADILGALTVSGAGLYWLKKHSEAEFVDTFGSDRLVSWAKSRMQKSRGASPVEADSME